MKVIVITERQQALLLEMCKGLIQCAKVVEEWATDEEIPIPPEAKKEILEVEALCDLIRSAPDSTLSGELSGSVIHRNYVQSTVDRCSTCDGGMCFDCTDAT